MFGIAPVFADIIDTTGPANQHLASWDITNFTVSDSFTVSAGTDVTEIDFETWQFDNSSTPAVMTNINWSISDSDLGGGTIFGSGSGAPVDTLLCTLCAGNAHFGVNTVDLDSNGISGLNIALAPGTYYLNLSNAASTEGTVFWDDNDTPGYSAFDSGIGGSHALANLALNGSDGSGSNVEAFTILASPEPATFLLVGLGLAGLGFRARRRSA